jgi:hypothetical protein
VSVIRRSQFLAAGEAVGSLGEGYELLGVWPEGDRELRGRVTIAMPGDRSDGAALEKTILRVRLAILVGTQAIGDALLLAQKVPVFPHDMGRVAVDFEPMPRNVEFGQYTLSAGD